MSSEQVWHEVGERVREAREAAGLSQGQLAEALGLDRTAVVRVESGQRQINAMELFRLSDRLAVPPAYFVSRPPAAMVSRRTAVDQPTAADRTRFRLDVELETQARDAQWLVERGTLRPVAAGVESVADPRELARLARLSLRQPTGPLGPIAEVAERFGLYLKVVDVDAEGASLVADGYGVAVIGATADPGRRRWTAAHELGHHLAHDEYSTDMCGVSTSREEREKIIDAFAGEFLLPQDDICQALTGVCEADLRKRLIRLAADYRISWSAAIRRAHESDRIGDDVAQRLRAAPPLRGDFLAVIGREPAPDLSLGERGPQWKRAVLAAYSDGLVTTNRAIELLGSDLTPADLPDIETS